MYFSTNQAVVSFGKFTLNLQLFSLYGPLFLSYDTFFALAPLSLFPYT